jgi:hypothetical protein
MFFQRGKFGLTSWDIISPGTAYNDPAIFNTTDGAGGYNKYFPAANVPGQCIISGTYPDCIGPSSPPHTTEAEFTVQCNTCNGPGSTEEAYFTLYFLAGLPSSGTTGIDTTESGFGEYVSTVSPGSYQITGGSVTTDVPEPPALNILSVAVGLLLFSRWALRRPTTTATSLEFRMS